MKKTNNLNRTVLLKPGSKKILIVMKLSCLLLTLTVFNASGINSFSQKTRLNLDLENVNIQTVLTTIEDQSEFFFLFSSGVINVNPSVDIHVKDKMVVEVLDELFANTDIKYVIRDRQILLVNKDSESKKIKQQIRITGTVIGEDGIPLPGVYVVLTGTTTGVVTGEDGKYSIDIPQGSKSLTFSFIGMESQEISINSQTIINVTLKDSAIELSEIVVIGYGQMKKSDLTGAITVLKNDELAYKATANVAQALQGKVAGVVATNNGAPGSSPVIRVRGMGSVRSDTEPLYVVDGVLTGNISFLSSNDVESMTVLKDASASAIYGIRAANGVIIITTKKGTKDKTAINYSGYTGFQKPVNIMEMADAKEYIQLLNEKGEIAARKTGGSFTPYNADDYNVTTDWFGEILRDKALMSNHDLSISGGNEKALYALGIGYYKQEGLMLYDLYKRIKLRASVESKIKDFINIGFTANFSNTNSDNSPNVSQDAFIAPPAVPVIDEATGNYMALTEFGDYSNPMVSLFYNNNITNNIRILGSGYAEFNLTKKLTFKSSYGLDGIFKRDRIYKPKYTLTGGTPSDEVEQLERKFAYNIDSYWDNTLTYSNIFGGRHNFTLMAGMSAQQQKGVWLRAARLGVPHYGTDNTLYLNLGIPDSQTNDDGGSRVSSVSYFGRLNYSFLERYLMTATVRRDGSSIFPKNNRYDIFPSVGLGWVISKENFMGNLTFFEHLKLRASWGEMGNNRIPELTAVSTVDYGTGNSTEFGGVIAQGASATYIGPANLMWEITREFDIAMEGMMLQSRLNFEFDYYNKKTLGAIFPVTTNSALGASNSSYLDNNADVQNKGVEVSLSWKDRLGSINYRMSGNISINHNEVVSLRPGTIGIYGGYMNVNASTYTTLGHPIGEFYGRQVIGIFQNDSEIQSYKGPENTPIQPNAQPGDFKYADINNDGTINDKDRTFLGSALPTHNYAFSLYMDYKGLDFQIDFYGQGGNRIYNAKRFRQIGNENYDKDFYKNRWHGEGTSTTYPSADMSSQDNKVVNSWTIEKGDFFRIQNMQIGYTLPQKLTSFIKIGSVRVYANAACPVTWFKYKGFTAEIVKTGPESATSQGVDSYVYPMSATYNFGLNINF